MKSSVDQKTTHKIRVLLAFGNLLLSDALKTSMESYGCQYSLDTLYPFNGNSCETWSGYDVILTDYLSLSAIPQECFISSKVLVMEMGLKDETVVSIFLSKKISGVIKGQSDISMLLKAIQIVFDGDIWIDNQTIRTMLTASMSRGIKESVKLTEREFALLRVVKEGYRNKEIASLLSISEQTVKSHLSRIFRKMNVSGRAELISRLSEFTNV